MENEAIASHLEDLLIPAQITEVYTVEELINSQVITVVNFPAKRGAGVGLEVLVLAVVKENGRAILLPAPDSESEKQVESRLKCRAANNSLGAD